MLLGCFFIQNQHAGPGAKAFAAQIINLRAVLSIFLRGFNQVNLCECGVDFCHAEREGFLLDLTFLHRKGKDTIRP